MMLLENCVRKVAIALLLLEANSEIWLLSIMKSLFLLLDIMGIARAQQTTANFLHEWQK